MITTYCLLGTKNGSFLDQILHTNKLITYNKYYNVTTIKDAKETVKLWNHHLNEWQMTDPVYLDDMAALKGFMHNSNNNCDYVFVCVQVDENGLVLDTCMSGHLKIELDFTDEDVVEGSPSYEKVLKHVLEMYYKAIEEGTIESA